MCDRTCSFDLSSQRTRQKNNSSWHKGAIEFGDWKRLKQGFPLTGRRTDSSSAHAHISTATQPENKWWRCYPWLGSWSETTLVFGSCVNTSRNEASDQKSLIFPILVFILRFEHCSKKTGRKKSNRNVNVKKQRLEVHYPYSHHILLKIIRHVWKAPGLLVWNF